MLPGLKEGREFYIVRLDDVDEKGAFERGQGSMLGASYARLRRALLHRRLIRHVESCREQFQARMDGKEKGVSFSLERDVKEIEAVQVFSARVEKTACKKKMRKVESEVVHEGVVETQGGEEQDDGCIPESLLARVRKRERAREEHAKRVTEDEENNVSLLSMLPVTMDTICNVLRSERRTAMGWGQLIRKVSKVHPKKWGLEDVDRQMEAIVNLGKDWCSKVALKSSRGGFAFRVVSEPDFAKARQLVCATETYKA